MTRSSGHVLVDVGLATLCAMRGRARPEDLTVADLDAAADEIEAAYTKKWLSSYLVCVYPNGVFTNPTFKDPTRRKAETDRALRSHHAAGIDGLTCAFTGEPAVTLLDRRHLPLMSGEEIVNFTPNVLGGLPVTGWVPLALHAFALGARRCLGRALAVHCDDDAITMELAARNLAYNRRQIALADQAAEGKYPDAKAPLTVVVAALREAARQRRIASNERRVVSVAAYHLTNSGQGADIDVYTLDACAVRFLLRAQSERYATALETMVRSAWRRERIVEGIGKNKRERLVAVAAPDPDVHRNYLYDDLFALPRDAARFARTHLLGRPDRLAREREDPRRSGRTRALLGNISWPLAELFLTEVLRMEKKRIDAVRTLGERLATRIGDQNDRRLLRALFDAKYYRHLRGRLVRSSLEEVRAGRAPLLGMDEFLLVFEQAEEVALADWGLARDMLCLRVLETLHASGFFRAHEDALAELGEEDETEAALQSAGEGAST